MAGYISGFETAAMGIIKQRKSQYITVKQKRQNTVRLKTMRVTTLTE